MKSSFEKIVNGYKLFRKKYVKDDQSIMQYLSENGQKPKIMIVACCDSRVDPALILQCDPGDLFVVRNVANIVPPYEKDETHHGTSAALEFGIRYLNVRHLLLLGHSQCGGVQTAINNPSVEDKNDFIEAWVSLIKGITPACKADDYAKLALHRSHQNCLSFPWIKERVEHQQLQIHLWFFEIKTGQIFTYSKESNQYELLSAE